MSASEAEAETERLIETRDWLLARCGVRPVVGIVCGSGLSEIGASVEGAVTLRYADIPHFPRATVAGHKDELVFGAIAGAPVVIMRGRFHMYEGNSPATLTRGVRVMALLGVRALIVTNAAGGLNPALRVGDVVCVSDHISFPGMTGFNPLVGHNDSRVGPRFPPMSDAYDPALRALVVSCAEELGFDFVRNGGVYACVSGPSYETGAESAFLHRVGADAVGMSTAPEVVAARHAGVRVLCMSLITNMAVMPGSDGPVASHQEVLDNVRARTPQVQRLVTAIIGKMAAMKDIVSEPSPLLVLKASPAAAGAVAGAAAADSSGVAAGSSGCKGVAGKCKSSPPTTTTGSLLLAAAAVGALSGAVAAAVVLRLLRTK